MALRPCSLLLGKVGCRLWLFVAHVNPPGSITGEPFAGPQNVLPIRLPCNTVRRYNHAKVRTAQAARHECRPTWAVLGPRTPTFVTIGCVSADTTTAGARGRPRDEERTAAILGAVHRVLHRTGWQDLRVADVAAEASCGLATIYRRWATKEELVAAAITERPLPLIDETGDARVDLAKLVEAIATDFTTMGESILGFMAAARSDPTLRTAVEESIVGSARPRIGSLIAEIVGDDHPSVDYLIDSGVGTLVVRIALLGETIDPAAYAAEYLALIDAVR